MSKVNPIQIQKFLKGMDYPAKKKDLIKQADKNGADKNVKEVLEQIPDDSYQTPAEVSQAIGDVD